MGDNLTLYTKYWLPFGELLTDLERTGIAVDVPYLRQLQLTAMKDRVEHEDKFTRWVQTVQENAQEFNASSTQQLSQLLFAPYNKKGKIPTEEQLRD